VGSGVGTFIYTPAISVAVVRVQILRGIELFMGCTLEGREGGKGGREGGGEGLSVHAGYFRGGGVGPDPKGGRAVHGMYVRRGGKKGRREGGVNYHIYLCIHLFPYFFIRRRHRHRRQHLPLPPSLPPSFPALDGIVTVALNTRFSFQVVNALIGGNEFFIGGGAAVFIKVRSVVRRVVKYRTGLAAFYVAGTNVTDNASRGNIYVDKNGIRP